MISRFMERALKFELDMVESEEYWQDKSERPQDAATFWQQQFEAVRLPHYRALIAECERLDWPECYTGDLVYYDRLSCQELAVGQPFLWAVRPTGTWLFPTDNQQSRRNARYIAHKSNEAEQRWYHWDGSNLVFLGTGEGAVPNVDSILDNATKEAAAQ
jgi:hypothetical protein